MHFSNPAALYALLALPVILLIHFLQERSRRVTVSTLFLLEHAAPVSARGARIERLRNSLPLWLQLLAALIVTWLLAEPRWTRQDSRQSIAVVLDSSVSMTAFQDTALEPALSRALSPWARAAHATDWLLMESDTRQPVLYRGSELSALLDSLKNWRPRRGAHDPADALVLARSLVKATGAVLYVSDHRPAALPAEAGLIAIGEPFPNVGFAGVTTASPDAAVGVQASAVPPDTTWTVLVRNHGDEPQTREWWTEWPQAPAESRLSAKKNLTLAPGQTLTFSGVFPAGLDRIILHLSPDRFTLDDSLPLIRPQPRRLRAEVRLSGETERQLFTGLLTALEDIDLDASAAPPDLVVTEIGEAVTTHAIQFGGAGTGSVPTLDPAPVLAENHPFTRDLDWAGLLTPAATPLTLAAADQPLLWKDGKPLALLRQDTQDDGARTQRLLLAWNPAESSAARNPAVPVFLHRFANDLRDRKRAFHTANYETGQPLPIAFPATAPRVLAQNNTPLPFRNRVPDEPGFFDLREGDDLLLSAAAHFGDTREARFTAAESLDETTALRRQAALKQTEADPYTPLWLLALLACLITSWRGTS